MAQSRSPFTVLIAVIFAILLLLFMYSVAEILLLLFISALFAVYLATITDFLQERGGLPRWMGVSIALLITIVGLTAVGWLIVPPVLEQTQGLLEALPALLARWEVGLMALAARYPLLREMMPPPESTGGYFSGAFGNLGDYFAGIFPYLYSGLYLVIHLFSVLVMGIYFALRPEMYREGVIALAPPVHRELVRDIFGDLANTLRAWIVGQILAMIFLGVLTWIGLELLRVPYALAFGVFTAVVAIVPFFGTLVSTLLPALFMLGSGGLGHALLVALLGVVVHLLEANFVAPVIMERKVHLPPVLTILSVLIMAELLGVIGLLVAVPVLATLMVIIRRIYIRRVLEGKGFRRVTRDAPAEIRVPAGVALVHPSVGQVSLPALLEEPVP
ncbi:MAG TPA: AI-2E family transporter [Longimicrobiaceae bacterium]|nr:AI-2E family transporter [Longimicrobiaceae bacterium]